MDTVAGTLKAGPSGILSIIMPSVYGLIANNMFGKVDTLSNMAIIR